MVNPPKTLTVTYGTFSCTLSGFDGSVETIERVTQYFRGIARDDPSFGVEQAKSHGAALANIAPVLTVTVDGDTIALSDEDQTGLQSADRAEPGTAQTDADKETIAARLERVRAAVSPDGSSAWPDEGELNALGGSPANARDPDGGAGAASPQAQEVSSTLTDEPVAVPDVNENEPSDAAQSPGKRAASSQDNIFASPDKADASQSPAATEAEPPVKARIVRMKHTRGTSEAADHLMTPDKGREPLDIAALDGVDELERFAQSPVESDASEDIDRLLNQTEREISSLEAGRRRASLTHLKAAVAATEAARDLGEAHGSSESETAFRDDLKQVVKTDDDGAQSDAQTVAGPLRLARSQRVDLADGDRTQAPVSPRRASELGTAAAPGTVELDGLPETKSAIQRFATFGELCDHIGADGLVDRVEACVTLLATQKGRAAGRPRVVRMVQNVTSTRLENRDISAALEELVASGRLVSPAPNRFKPTDDTFRRLEALAY